jgi:Mu transposase, C-terminal
VAKQRRVQQDGIAFQGQRYFDLTLAAYVGEDVTIRYDPRDLAVIRVFYKERFGYPLKAGQLTYDCRYPTMHGMPVTGGRGFRGLKPL